MAPDRRRPRRRLRCRRRTDDRAIRTRARAAASSVDPDALRIGLPESASWSSSATSRCARAHLAARAARSAVGRGRRASPFAPFLAAGELLYQGPWVAERLAEFGDFLAGHRDSVLPGDPGRSSRAAPRTPRSTSSPPSTGSASCGPMSPLWASDGRAGAAGARHHVHPRAGARRSDRHQHSARPLHPLREPARPVRRRRARPASPPDGRPCGAHGARSGAGRRPVLGVAAALDDGEPPYRQQPAPPAATDRARASSATTSPANRETPT